MIDNAIRLGAIAILFIATFNIVQPFVGIVMWAVIIAVSIYPAYIWMARKLGGRKGTAAAAITILGLLIIIVPAAGLTTALIDTAQAAAAELEDGAIEIPPPAASVAEWPFVGERLHALWSLAANNLEAALETLKPQLQSLGSATLSVAAAAGIGVLQFAVSLIISGILLAKSGSGSAFATATFERLAPGQGERLSKLAEGTIRGVASGVIGVALIQSLLAGIGFVIADIPGAGFWAFLCLLLGIMQLSIALVCIPVIIYAFSALDTTWAIVFLVYNVPVIALDNVLKPLLMGRGVEAPMLVVFVGAIGGFITSGFIGLFVGAVVLVLAYELFQAWVAEPEADIEQTQAEGQHV